MPYLVDRLRQGFVEYGCSNLNSIKVEQPEEMNAYGAGLKAAIKLNEIIESEEWRNFTEAQKALDFFLFSTMHIIWKILLLLKTVFYRVFVVDDNKIFFMIT